MDTNTLQGNLCLKQLTSIDTDKNINGCCICDLLSRVMANGEEEMAWITVLTHLNVIAVASLHEFSCVIIPESIEVPKETIDKAQENDIIVFSSDRTAYELACGMHDLGI